MARRTARMYYYPYDESGQWNPPAVDVQVGDRFSTIAPYSEVMMHMNIAGKPIEVEIVSERAAQIYVDGQPFSIPVTLGEAGIYREGGRKTASDPNRTAADDRFERMLEEYRQNVLEQGVEWADGVLFSRHPSDAEYIVEAYEERYGPEDGYTVLDYEQDMADQVGFETDLMDAYHAKRKAASHRRTAGQLQTEEYNGVVGVNVKTYQYDFSDSGIDELTESEANSAMDSAMMLWWDMAHDMALDAGLSGVESDGRMGGWLIPLWAGERIEWDYYSNAPSSRPGYDPSDYDQYVEQEEWERMVEAVDDFVDYELSTFYTNFSNTLLRDEVEFYLGEREASRRTARRKVAVNAADVTTGPWDVQVYNEEGPAYSEYGLDGWTAYCSRPVYVNGTHVATQEVNAGYSVVVVSTDESVNPDRDYPMDPSDFDDPKNPPEGVQFDVQQVVEDRLLSASDESELYSDYDYEDAGHPMFFDTFERAVSEAKANAQGWQGAPWLRDSDPLPERYLSYLD